jgi:signal transduction histidine kinase
MQIRYRLTIQFILIAAGILVAAFLYVHFQFKKNLHDEFYNSLRSKALIIAEMVAGTKTDEQEFKIDPPVNNSTSLLSAYPENISMFTMSGDRLYTFNPSRDDYRESTFADIRNNGECKFSHGRYSAYGTIYRNKLGEQYIVIAESIFDDIHLNHLTNILIVVFLISITLVAIGGWFFAREALSPVSAIMNELDAVLPSDMSHRLATKPNQQDELSRMVITFNRLLDRIQHAFKNQKMFLSNISHELKNPLNVIVSQVEVTLDKERSADDYRQTLNSVLSDVKELNEVAEKLMQLARINADDTAIQFQPLRIDELIWQSKSTLLKNHPEYIIHFDIINLPDQESHLIIMANEHLFRTALLNLMDNGCKFSDDHKVRVSLAVENEQCIVEIADRGPGIPESELALVFDPFYRSPRTAATKGSGIGLSLVNSILKLHHIEISVTSVQGSGTTFILRCPIAQTHHQLIALAAAQ